MMSLIPVLASGSYRKPQEAIRAVELPTQREDSHKLSSTLKLLKPQWELCNLLDRLYLPREILEQTMSIVMLLTQQLFAQLTDFGDVGTAAMPDYGRSVS